MSENCRFQASRPQRPRSAQGTLGAARRRRRPSSPAACRRTRCSTRRGWPRSSCTRTGCSTRSAWRSAATRSRWNYGAGPGRSSPTAAACTCPPGCARQIVQHSAPRVFTQHARNPGPQRARSAATHTVFAPAYGPPFVSDLQRGRRYGTLEDFHNFIKLDLPGALAAPFRRHGLRAGGRAGQQAPLRHGLRAHALLGQGIHGLGHDRRPRRRLDRDVPACCSARSSSPATA